MRIIAIDPGTQCGYAWTDDGKVHVEQSGVWDLKPRRHEGGGMRYLRVKRSLEELIRGVIPPHWQHDPDKWEKCNDYSCAVFYEEVRRHRGVDAAHIYGGIIATIAAVCEEHEIPYQGIPVGTIKKRATGKGNANKEAMVNAAIREFWVDESRGLGGSMTNDRADALWILQCGIDELGA